MKIEDFLNQDFLDTPTQRNEKDFYEYILDFLVQYRETLSQVKVLSR